MAVIFPQMVNHKLNDNNWFNELKDEERDKVFFKINGMDEPSKNYKQFIINQPSIKSMITPYHHDLFVSEMKYELFHNIQYKEVDNKEFFNKLRKYNTIKHRMFANGKWVTYYFNKQTKLKLVESDFIVNLSIYAGYPHKGMSNFLLKPCQFEHYEQPPQCVADSWAILTRLRGINNCVKDDWCSIASPKPGVVYGDGPLEGAECIKFEEENLLYNNLYFYIRPGERDYILEAYTIDCNGMLSENRSKTKYYILDREGEYFKKYINYETFSLKVIKEYNKQKIERINLQPEEGKTSDAKIVTKKKIDNFKTINEMFFSIGRSWIGRHNSFFKQWNEYMKKFNKDNKGGYYCPPKQKPPAFQGAPQIDGYIDPAMLNLTSGSLIQQTIMYEKKDIILTTTKDIRFFDINENMFYDFYSDRFLEDLRITEKTLDIFLEYAIIR